MSKRPEISIIMNCHNGEKFLYQALDSILKQSFKNWELIFWNNRSADKSENIYKKFKDKRLRYFYTHKKVSLYESRNAALKKARGKFISFLDVDDIWFPDKLKLQLKKFKDKDVGLVYGKYIKISKNNFFRKRNLITKKNLPEGYITQDLLKSYNVGLLTIMLRSKFLRNKKTVFRTKYNYLGDLDFVLNFSLKYKFAAVQHPIGIYRQHDNQMQKKFRKIKSHQFTQWFNEIARKKTFGNHKNLKLFEEWERFQSHFTIIKQKRNLNIFLKIIKYPNNLNKIKLLILFFTPEFISKRIVSET
ncbi:MAG: glycosyl transferase family 2 [Candidatus Marinimicrobia bacterium]|nr:glycosyl transferase family 2 [Candidatus Neomarinimicrobiota bacterium]